MTCLAKASSVGATSPPVFPTAMSKFIGLLEDVGRPLKVVVTKAWLDCIVISHKQPSRTENFIGLDDNGLFRGIAVIVDGQIIMT